MKEKGERNRLKGKKWLLMLTLTFLLGAVIASVPAGSSSTVSFYVEPIIKSGESPGTYFSVDVWIDSPIGWRNSTNGIVGWTFDVKVNASIIQPAMVDGGVAGYFLYDFLVQYNHRLEGYSVSLLTAPISPATGIIRDIAEMIMPTPFAETFGAGGSGKLCKLWFKSYSLTGYSPIDISNAWYWMTDGSKPAVDIVYDGHYNEPPVGGILIPVDKFGLLAPYIALASTILVATAATAIYVKRVKRRKKKQ